MAKRKNSGMAFSQTFAEFLATYGNELTAKVDRLTGIIGKKHWLSVGLYKESLVKSMLANKLPQRCEVGTGFVLAQKNGKAIHSRQIDILIWDANGFPPLFRDGDFVIVSPEAVLGAVEVKSTLTSKTLQDALKNLDSLSKFRDTFEKRGDSGPPVHRSVFAFASKLEFPSLLFDHVYDYYRRSKRWALDERIAFSVTHRQIWSLPWITNIAVLGTGVLNCAQVPINDQPMPCYCAYRSDPQKEDPIDAYNFVERSIMMDLMLGYLKLEERRTLPDLTRLLFINPATRAEGKCYMPLREEAIGKLGWGADPGQWNVLADRNYVPSEVVRKPRRKKKRGDKEEGPDESAS